MAKSELMTKIYSQASNDVVIPTYEKQLTKPDGNAAQKSNVIESAIIIKGGANVAYGTGKGIQNSKHALTEVTADELKTLQAHPAFMRKVKRGFITIGEAPADYKSDTSAQLTEKQMKIKAPKATAKTGPVED